METLRLKNSQVLSKESFSYISRNGTLHSSSQARNIRKKRPEKDSLYFMKWNILSLILITFSNRKSRKKFFIFQQTEVLKKLLIFREMELFNPPSNISHISGNRSPKNFLYFLKRKLSLYFRKRNFLIFRERLFRTLTHLDLEAYSEPWYIQNQRHIQNTVKYRRWNVL